MDSDLWIQILELVILLALSGFFSSAETAMVSVSKIRLRTLEDEGNKKASLALRILENQSKMLSAILIGNNLVNTSAASIPIALSEMSDQGLLQRGDKIIVAGFGGGLTWGGALIEW